MRILNSASPDNRVTTSNYTLCLAPEAEEAEQLEPIWRSSRRHCILLYECVDEVIQHQFKGLETLISALQHY